MARFARPRTPVIERSTRALFAEPWRRQHCRADLRGNSTKHWIWRGLQGDINLEAISVIFGVIQMIIYVDFAGVYRTRQRVKLQYGGIIDSDDLNRSWLIGRILSHEDTEIDGANGDIKRPRANARWGAHGISVSADEAVLDAPQEKV